MRFGRAWNAWLLMHFHFMGQYWALQNNFHPGQLSYNRFKVFTESPSYKYSS